MWVVLVVVVILFLVTEENKVNSNSDQLKLGWVCKFGVGFDNKKVMPTPLPPLLSLFQKNFEEFDQYFPVYFRWAYIIEEFFSMFRDKHLKKTIRTRTTTVVYKLGPGTVHSSKYNSSPNSTI